MTRNINPRVREEAEQWLVRRLEPDVCEVERAAFERWCAQDAEHAAAYCEVEQLWDDLAVLRQSSRLREIGSQAMASTSTARRKISLLLAASLAAIAIAVAFWRGDRPQVQSFATAIGEQRTETLADGTTLRLDTHSALDVRLSRSRREILLKSGTAGFDVAKDATRPFIVAAGDGAVTAIGTHFQVRHEAATVTVTLIEGRVQVARPAYRETEWLDPGQEARFAVDASGIVRRNVDLKAAASWMSGRLEFRATPLDQAVAEINRYSARKIRIADPAVHQVAVSGTFRTGDADGAAAAFEAAFPVRAEVGEQEIVLYSK